MDLAPYIASEFGISDVVLLPKLEGDMSEIEGRIVGDVRSRHMFVTLANDFEVLKGFW